MRFFNRLHLLLLISIFFGGPLLFSQNVDSLIRLEKKAAPDSKEQVSALLSLSNYFRKKYPEKSRFYAEKGLEIAQKIRYKQGIREHRYALGEYYLLNGDYKNAHDNFSRSLRLSEELKLPQGIADGYNQIGRIYNAQRNYSKAREYFFKALPIYKQIKDLEGICFTYNNIGVIHFYKQQYDSALFYYEKDLKLKVNRFDSAEIALSYFNIGLVHEFSGNYEMALPNYERALALYRLKKDKNGISAVYTSIGAVYAAQNNPEAVKYLNQSLDLSSKYDLKPRILDAYEVLISYYEQKKDFQKALSYQKMFSNIKDMLFNEDSQKQINEMQSKYESDKKDKEIELLNKNKKIAEIEKRRQNLITGSVIAILLCVVFIAFFVFKNLRKTKKQKLEIEEQKQLLEEKNNEIVDSISYAKRIQSAILPQEKQIKKVFPDSFVLYRPKDIVAGDFYWFEASGGMTFLAAADCTGHGVPGALVSVVCNNALNRSVKEYGLKLPGEILDKTREIIISEFEKSDEDVKDGMDISLCAFDFSKRKLYWAGAHNPLWVIRNGELTEYKADKQPIGKFAHPLPFTTHEIELESGDEIYSFTDGFQDQFGLPAETRSRIKTVIDRKKNATPEEIQAARATLIKGKKFKTAQMRDLFLSLKGISMDRKSEQIESAFEKWRTEIEQVDDICIIGIRIN